MYYELATSTWGPEEREAAHRVIDSGFYTMGKEVAAFERQFADYFGAKHAVMVNSGSSANLAATAAFFFTEKDPLKPGDEVIVPALSWSTTYHPLQQYGLKLKFVDIEADTLNMDCSRLEEALGPKTKAIVAVSILGNPAALDVMRAFADKHGLRFLEDNCESMDAELGGRKAGTFGDIGTFSFFFSHHISTMEGGMAITDSRELADLMRVVRAHGWTRDIADDSPVHRRGQDEFFEAYRFILPGYNLRPTEVQGAIGQIQLRKLPGMTVQRRANWAHFQARLGNDPRWTIQRENGISSAFCFPMTLADSVDRAKVFAALKEADIGYRIVTGGNFLRHPVIRHYDYETVGEMTVADRVHDRGLFVGNHAYDLTEKIDRLAEVMDQACR